MDPNADDRVRPVPIEPGDAEASRGLAVEADPARSGRTRRPWLPLAIAASAIAIVFVSVTAFGALQFEDPERPDAESFASDFVSDDEEDVSTTTLPPSLEEMIPGVRDRLTIITRDGDGVWAVIWDPSFRVPNQEAIEAATDPVGIDLRASFDRSGQYVALTKQSSGRGTTLIGRPTALSDVGTIEASDITWHASEVGRLAFAEFDGATTTVHVGTIDPATGILGGVETVLTIDGIAELTRFDRYGFIMRNSFTRAYDPEGRLLWEVEGVWPASSNDSILLVVDEAQRWLQVDRATGAPVDASHLVGTLGDSAFWVSTTEDTDLIARIAGDPDEGRFSLTVVGGGMRAPRIKSFDEPLYPLRFTLNGDYFVFTDRDRTRLVFVDWWSGAEYTVPMPEGHAFLDFHLG